LLILRQKWIVALPSNVIQYASTHGKLQGHGKLEGLNLSKDIWQFFVVSGISNFAIVLPKAVLTPVLVARGLSFSDVLIVQTAFMAAILLCEIPSGYLADRYSRKAVYLISIVVTGAAYMLVYWGYGLSLMILAWALYGAGSALRSCTMDFYFMAKVRGDAKKYKQYFVLSRNIPLISSIAAAALTSILFLNIGDALYLVSLALFILSLLLGAIFLPSVRKDGTPGDARSRSILVDSWRSLRKRASGASMLYLIAILCLTQIAFTPFYQLWQMVLLERGIEPYLFGAFFIVFQVINIAANWLFSKLTLLHNLELYLLVLLLLITIIALSANSTLPLLGSIFVLPLLLYCFNNRIEMDLEKSLPEGVMSSLGSIAGAASGASSLLVLSLNAWMLNFLEPQTVMFTTIMAFSLITGTVVFIPVFQKRAKLHRTDAII
jgi:MFS family permease